MSLFACRAPIDSSRTYPQNREVSAPGAPKRFAPAANAPLRIPRGFVVALRDAKVDVAGAARAAGIDPARLEGVEPTLAAVELGTLFEQIFAHTIDQSMGRWGCG
jgi:hypothetical protein